MRSYLLKIFSAILSDLFTAIIRHSYVFLLWNKTFSEKFSVSNGVRQGDVLSPILFIVYIDEYTDQISYIQSQAVAAIGHSILLEPLDTQTT